MAKNPVKNHDPIAPREKDRGGAPADTRVNLCGIVLDNPVIPASGTFGYGHEFAEIFDINRLGTFSFKGTTLHPRFGNALPRIAECPCGMLNAVGLQNPGVKAVIETELPLLKKVFHKKVMANISGFSTEEYVHVAALLDGEKQVGWIELNISCPNVKGGGHTFGSTPEDAYRITAAVKKAMTKPLIVKLSPNVSDIAKIAAACESGGADGLSLINTLLGMRIDKKTRKPVLAEKTGGISGPALLPLALRMVYQVYKAVNIPIIGMGGVSCADDVIEFILAGATAVGVGAANLAHPRAALEIIEALPAAMEKHGITKLSEITGEVHQWEEMS